VRHGVAGLEPLNVHQLDPLGVMRVKEVRCRLARPKKSRSRVELLVESDLPAMPDLVAGERDLLVPLIARLLADLDMTETPAGE